MKRKAFPCLKIILIFQGPQSKKEENKDVNGVNEVEEEDEEEDEEDESSDPDIEEEIQASVQQDGPGESRDFSLVW